MDGTSFTDSELLEKPCESASMVVNIEGTNQLSCQELIKLYQEGKYRPRHGHVREDDGDGQCSTQSTGKPLEVLHKELNNYQEHDELFEFTKLENELEDCVFKEKENIPKSDWEMLNDKVKHLMQDNEDLQNTIRSKEIEIAEMKLSLSSRQEVQSLTEKSINNIGIKLNQFIMGNREEVLESSPSAVLINNSDDGSSDSSCLRDSNDVYSVEDIHHLVDLVLKHHKEASERKLQNYSLNTNSVNTEISTLKNKVLELSNSNNMLVVSNEKLIKCLTSEKQSVSYLQKNVIILKNIVATKRAFKKNFESEKVLLVELLDHIETNEHIGEHLLSFSENLSVTKDIVQAFTNKFIIISRKLLFINKELANSTELCSVIKSDLTKLYDYCQFGHNLLGYSDMISVKEELELLKKECSHILSQSKKIGKSAEKGKDVVESLVREVNKIKQENLDKDIVINCSMCVISDRQREMEENEIEVKNCLFKINSMVLEKSVLENEVKTFSDQIFRIGNILSKLCTDVPIETVNLSDVMEHMSQDFKEGIKNSWKLIDLAESIHFFKTQYSHLIVYVKELKNKYMSTENKNVSLAEEVNMLKEHLTRTQTHIDEADKFLNRIISFIPYKISSINQAMEAAGQIFSEYRTLKEKEKVVFDEQIAQQDKLSKQLNNINLVDNFNSDLKVQLESYENEIRYLRSELRNLRSQCRRKDVSRVTTNEQESQTGNLCCREFQDKVFKLEELAEARSLKITSLKLHLMNKNLTYKKKVSELECALFQAKERIRVLRCELTEMKQ